MLMAAGAVTAILSLPSSATGSSTTATQPQVIDDSQMQILSTTVGGASPLATTKTVQHFFATTFDPDNGVTYGYNMVGADPNNCSGSACDVTIPVDIIPLIVVVGGMTFDPTDSHQALNGALASPEFALNDYGLTPNATAAGAFPNAPAFIRGPGGPLSQNDAGNQLQLQDATMRSQFNQTGSSLYHLRLGTPTVHAPITIVVPPAQGTLLVSGRGVIFPSVNIQWWSTQIQHLKGSLSFIDPTHLPIFLTDSVMLFFPPNPANCCVIGFHGAAEVPSKPTTGVANGPQNGNGNQAVQTFAWASWIRPGIFARALPPQGTSTDWAVQDIHGLSHEVSEWADDPFINNSVEGWTTPTAQSAGCSFFLETGDPVTGIGFAKGINTFDQTPNPNGTISFDGFYHPEDEVHLPWFMRLAPNTVSEPTQSPSTNIGRYTFMGDLNPFPGFRMPAADCQ